MRGGIKKVNKNILLFVDLVARVLANGNRTIEKVTNNNPLNSTRATCTGCLHYNQIPRSKDI